MRTAQWIVLSGIMAISRVAAEDSVEKQAETLLTDAMAKLRSSRGSEVWKSFSAKSRNTLRIALLDYLSLQKQLSEKHPPEKEEEQFPEPSPLEKLQLENDPEYKKEVELRHKISKESYVERKLHQWGFEKSLEETTKLSNDEFWKTFVKHQEDAEGEAYRDFMAKDPRLNLWNQASKGEPGCKINSTKIENDTFTIESTLQRSFGFHSGVSSLFLLPIPWNPAEKPPEKIPFTWTGMIHGGKLELNVPPAVIENVSKWNVELHNRLQEP